MTPAERFAKKHQRKREPRNAMRIGKHVCQVRTIREKLQITLNASARAVGISPAGLSAIERGADVQLSTMRKLTAFYGKKLDDLWPN